MYELELICSTTCLKRSQDRVKQTELMNFSKRYNTYRYWLSARFELHSSDKFLFLEAVKHIS